jgi:hypothetical protein
VDFARAFRLKGASKVDEVRELPGPGEEGHAVTLGSDSSEDVRSALKSLLPPPVAWDTSRQISCWPPEGTGTTFLYVLERDRIAYVRGERVETAGGVFRDAESRLFGIAQRLVTLSSDVPGLRAGVCSECDTPTPGDIFECLCSAQSAPGIVAEWQYEGVIGHNNCYSYAWNKRMCGTQRGSKPGNRDHRSLDTIIDALERIDHLEPVDTESFMADQGIARSGRFIALLATEAGGYHFLRLDEQIWTHKVGGYPVSTCDRNRQAIPWDGLLAATFSSVFPVRRYYRVPAGARLVHCF